MADANTPMPQDAPARPSPSTSPAYARINQFVAWCLRHWLLLTNGLALVYAGLPWLSPLARSAGFERLGIVLFWIYRPLCHQNPERSFWFLGYQVAYCHRCTALYTAILAAGLLFGALRRTLKPLPLKFAGLLMLPMLIDGLMHMFDDVTGLALRGHEHDIGSFNFVVRIITGVLVGVAVLLVIYPRVERELEHSDTLIASAS